MDSSEAPRDFNEIAYQVLVELLAHQFAYPVRWIDTQDVLLSNPGISRLIEVGPSNVLANMAKKTNDAKYKTMTAIQCLDRSFLSATKDIAQVRYQYSSNEVCETTSCNAIESTGSAESTPLQGSVQGRSKPPQPKQMHKDPLTLTPKRLPTHAKDVPVTPLEVIRALIAARLKKPLASISTDKTLKQLSSGKSTMQNEWIGDITAEFGSVPDHAEDLPLTVLVEGLEKKSQDFGKGISTLLNRWVSFTMPGGFGMPAVKKYLETKWLMGQGRQLSVILVALVNSTAAGLPRHASETATKEFLDEAVAEYAKSCGLDLDRATETTPIQSDAAAFVDPTALAGLSAEIKELATLQQSSLARFLNIEDDSLKTIVDLEAIRDDQQAQLDTWLVRATSQVAFLESSDTASVTLGRLLSKVIFLSLESPPLARFSGKATKPTTRIDADGIIRCLEIPRSCGTMELAYADVLKSWDTSMDGNSRRVPISLKVKNRGSWALATDMTNRLIATISSIVNDGITLHSKVVLVTGAGQGSIGAEIIRKLVMGGARVIVTTSRPVSEAQDFYRGIYKEFGARDSELFVLPFNQASRVDCKKLIEYVFRTLGMAINAFLPLAAIPEKGLEVDQIGERSELAHRLMMTNVIRLIGFIVQEKANSGTTYQPTQVLLPLSPNHGTFGGDGLYSESKLGLEGLLNRVSSEGWGDKVSVCGVVIGWTRGTGLMSANDIVAEAVEAEGALTFTTEDMALNILALLSPEVSRFWEDDSILADFSGCLGLISDLKAVITQARTSINEEAEMRRMSCKEDKLEALMTAQPLQPVQEETPRDKRSRLQLQFPRLPNFKRDLKPLSHMNSMADPESTVVIVGFSELGPWGSSRTRWQMEAYRQLSTEGYVELAWLMGMIKRHEKPTSPDQIGWVDAETGKLLLDHQIGDKYGRRIFDNCGIRLIQPESGPFNPTSKDYLHEVAIQDDIPEFETDFGTAEAIKRKHGEHAVVTRTDNRDAYRVKIKAGARIFLPKAAKMSYSMVAGLLPKGWSPSRLGIPEDIIDQVDPVTLYALYCAAEAFLSAGLEDPMEVFEHMHVSEVGNFIGSSLGGTEKNRDMFRNAFLDRQVQGDVLQETNPNTPAAWVNMLLLGGSGPIKTPVGACATSLESLDGAVDSILAGKTKMCLIGGVDALHEDEGFAFSTMKATVNCEQQFAQGRQPSELSRPTSETRAGFLEAEGGGVQLLCSAAVAIEMGLPIYAVVAGSTLASDKIGRSVPAPGQGLLTFAKEATGADRSPYLDMSYRRQRMDEAISHLLSTSSSTASTTSDAGDSTWSANEATPCVEDVGLGSDLAQLESQSSAIRKQWTNDFRRMDPGISPMRAALATWGLTIDDITVVSLHATSTRANDLNEPKTLQQQMNHLGRRGAPMIAMCQKSVTGHPKAPAAAWMLNGCLQVLQTGLIPGNYACDNIDSELSEFDHLVFPSETMQVAEVKAFLLNSFGFGQKGAQMIGVAPKYFFATLSEEEYRRYSERCNMRKRLANRAFERAIMSNSIVRPHERPPYRDEDLAKVLLDPQARAQGSSSGAAYDRIRFNLPEGHSRSQQLNDSLLGI
ncbi:putative PKS/NRPS-like protein biosynthetic cluster [Gnomoniopsis sp. IMI 355080]|nr:putative PKS/NRPS-like protein biosynthetic cluster [Gnomoniopsis sp. IMI 355080]